MELLNTTENKITELKKTQKAYEEYMKITHSKIK